MEARGELYLGFSRREPERVAESDRDWTARERIGGSSEGYQASSRTFPDEHALGAGQPKRNDDGIQGVGQADNAGPKVSNGRSGALLGRIGVNAAQTTMASVATVTLALMELLMKQFLCAPE